MKNKLSRDLKQTLWSSTLFFFGAPLIILLHESAHWLMAVFLGYQAVFTSAEVRMSSQAGLTDLMPMLAIGIAGPLVEASLAVTGVVCLWKYQRRDHDTPAPFRYWSFSLLTLAGLRWFKVACDGVHSDEAKISQALGMHYFVIPLVMLIPSLLVLVFILRVHWIRGSLAPLFGGFAVGVIGVVFWLQHVGPALLPR